MLQPGLKSIVAAAVLALLWIGESWVPFYTEYFRRDRRFRHDRRNLAFGLTNAAVVALLFSSALALAVSWSAREQFGLLRMVSWPVWLEAFLAFLLLDLWMYLWHVANHQIPWLWRLHRMHHSDPDMDATTGLRFHTGEAFFSAAARLVVLPLIGAELWQLVVYELVFLPIVLLHHSNVRLPRWLDYGLLALIVTPAMHRVHHSRWRAETDSNYGSVFPYWDMLLRTFRLRSDARTIRLGLDEMDDPKWQTLIGMLKTPFIGGAVRPSADAPSDSKSEQSGQAIASGDRRAGL